MGSSNKSPIVKNTLFYTIGGVLPKLLKFAFLPVFTRFLLPEDYAVLGYGASITLISMIIANLSINSFLIRKYFELNSEEKRVLVFNCFFFMLLSNIIVFAVIDFTLPQLFQYYNVKIEYSPYIKLMLLNNVLMSSVVILQSYLKCQQKAFKFVLLGNGSFLLRLILSYVLVVYLGKGLIGKISGEIIGTGILFLFCSYVLLKESRFKISKPLIKEAFYFSLPLLPAALSIVVMEMFPRVALERYVSKSQLGLYSVAYIIGISITYVINGINNALQPVLFGSFRTNNSTDTFNGIKTSVPPIIMLMAILGILWHKFFVYSFLPEAYSEISSIIYFFLITSVLVSYHSINRMYIVALKKHQKIYIMNIIAAVVSILPIFFLGDKIGVYAAVVSYFAAHFVIYLFSLRYLRGLIGNNYKIKNEVVHISVFIVVIFLERVTTAVLVNYSTSLMFLKVLFTLVVIKQIHLFISKVQKIKT